MPGASIAVDRLIRRLTSTLTLTNAGDNQLVTAIVIEPGGERHRIDVKADNQGTAIVPFVPQGLGTITIELRPSNEYDGTTTPKATFTGLVQAGENL